MYRLLFIGTLIFSLLGNFVCFTNAYGQLSNRLLSKGEDSLQHSLPHKSQVELYFRMSNKAAKNDPDEAWEYLKKGKEYAGSDAYLNAKAAFYEAQILTHTDQA